MSDAKIEIQMDEELTRFVAYLKDEMKDAIMRHELRQILEDDLDTCYMEEDKRYYRKLKLAAQRMLRHYTVHEDFSDDC